MATPKNNHSVPGEERNPSSAHASEASHVNDEENLDTRYISHDVEEGDEDYDDEELTEADFAVDEMDDEEDEDL